MKIFLILLLLILPLNAESLKRTLLAQSQLSSSATSIYSPPTGKSAIIKKIVACNTESAGKTFDIYLSNAGTIYTAATALIYQCPIGANETILFEFTDDGIYITNAGGNLAGKCSSGSSVTLSVFGFEVLSG
jgi:hypothetical protein